MREVDSWLFEAFEKRNKKNSKYSLRSFARDLQLSVSYLSRVFNGKTNISENKVQELCEVLNINPDNKGRILKKYQILNSIEKELEVLVQEEMNKGVPNKNQMGLSSKDCIKLSSWHAPLVFHFIENHSGTQDHISKKLSQELSIEYGLVATTIKELLRIGLIKSQGNGFLKNYQDYYLLTEGDAITVHELTKNHLEASKKLLTTPAAQSFTHRNDKSNSLDFTILPVKENEFIYEKLFYNFYTETKNKYTKENKRNSKIHCIQLYFVTMKNRGQE
jgi:uncharacterized protein (TIGR02147 family)